MSPDANGTKFRFSAESPEQDATGLLVESGHRGKHISVEVIDCPLCQQCHETPLLRMETPLRILADHTTYSFRVECPRTSRHILIEDWTANPVNVWIVAPPDPTLVPHME